MIGGRSPAGARLRRVLCGGDELCEEGGGRSRIVQAHGAIARSGRLAQPGPGCVRLLMVNPRYRGPAWGRLVSRIGTARPLLGSTSQGACRFAVASQMPATGRASTGQFPNNLRFYGTLAPLGRRPASSRPGTSEPSGDTVPNQNRTDASDQRDDTRDKPGHRAHPAAAGALDHHRDSHLDRCRSLRVERRDRRAHLGRQCRRGSRGARRRADRQRVRLRAAGRTAGRADSV